MQHKLSLRIIGFLASLILTLATYYIIVHPDVLNFDTQTTIMVIFTFALIQALIQLIFFINVWKEKGPLWNLSVFLSTVSIIFVIIFFSIWIMNNLNYNMEL